MQGENGSLIYLMPGFQSYDASQTYMPISPVGVSSQALHSPMYAAQGYYQNQFGYADLSSPTYLWDPVGDKYVYGVASNTQPLKQNISSSSHNHNNYYSKSKNSYTGHSMGDRPKTPRKVTFVLFKSSLFHIYEKILLIFFLWLSVDVIGVTTPTA